VPFAKVFEFYSRVLFFRYQRLWLFHKVNYRHILNDWSLLLYQESFICDWSGCFRFNARFISYIEMIRPPTCLCNTFAARLLVNTDPCIIFYVHVIWVLPTERWNRDVIQILRERRWIFRFLLFDWMSYRHSLHFWIIRERPIVPQQDCRLGAAYFHSLKNVLTWVVTGSIVILYFAFLIWMYSRVILSRKPRI